MALSGKIAHRIQARILENPSLRFQYDEASKTAIFQEDIYVEHPKGNLGKGGYGSQHIYRKTTNNVPSNPTFVVIKTQLPDTYLTSTTAFGLANTAVVNHDFRGMGAFYAELNPNTRNPSYSLAPFLPGINFSEVVIIDTDKLLEYCTKLMLDLKHLHASGCVHGDPKRSNALLDEKHKTAVLIDYDLTRQLGELTLGNRADYQAKELKDSIPSETSQDVYSMGKLFHRMVFKGVKKKIIFANSRQEQEFLDLITKMTNDSISERPSVDEVLNALKKIRENRYVTFDDLNPNRSLLKYQKPKSIPLQASVSAITPEEKKRMTSSSSTTMTLKKVDTTAVPIPESKAIAKPAPAFLSIFGNKGETSAYNPDSNRYGCPTFLRRDL